ncbi:MAG: hypothetical protein IKF11_02430 [Methanobrevibacter sp.]|nr:hypothetical protein [Methanobrevibacter sp.]
MMALTQKQLAALDACPVMKELKDWIIAMDNEDEPAIIKKYWFLSYGDSAGEQPLDKGTAKTTGVTQSGYTQIVVLTNDEHPDFVGEKYWVVSNALPSGDDLYQLYTGAGTGATGMYVKISTSPFPEEETDDD